MGVSKVDLNGETLVDLTKDTVNENSLLSGYSAHNAAGEKVNGAVAAVPTTTSLAVTEEGVSALDGSVGKVLNDKIDELNNNFGTLSFAQDADGNWGYRVGGADTVTPFKKYKYNYQNFSLSPNVTKTVTFDVFPKYIFIIRYNSKYNGGSIVIDGSIVTNSAQIISVSQSNKNIVIRHDGSAAYNYHILSVE